MQYDIKRARAAIQYLVDTSYFQHHVKKLRSSVLKPRTLPFKDEAEVLNELLIVGRQNIAALESLIALAEFKRDDYNAYQAKLMAQRRARERKAIKLHEHEVGKSLSLEERKRFLQTQYDMWNIQKDGHVAQCTKEYIRQHGTEPTWEAKNQFIKDFWALVDMNLDVDTRKLGGTQQEMYAASRKQDSQPSRQSRTFSVRRKSD